MNELIVNPYAIGGIIILSIIGLTNYKKIIEIIGAWKANKQSNKENIILSKQDEQIKLIRELINGNTKMRQEFEDSLKKALTYQQVEHIIYNQIKFLELKQ